MIARVLRTELRRTIAKWIVVALVVLGALILYAADVSWGGRWTQLALTTRTNLFFLWPLALGMGAWQARRESRSRIGELLTTTARPRWQRVTPTAGALGLAAVVGYLGIFAAGAVRVAGTARLAVAAWLIGEPPPSTRRSDAGVDGPVQQAWNALRALPPAEQQARIQEVRAAALACDGRDLLDILTEGSQPA